MSCESMKRPLALPLGRLTMVLMMSPGTLKVVVGVGVWDCWQVWLEGVEWWDWWLGVGWGVGDGARLIIFR